MVDACDAIAEVLAGVDFATYGERRPIRSAVEREFTVIGEATNALARRDPGLAALIAHARLIVGLRNRLVHEDPEIDDEPTLSLHEV